MAIIDNFRKQTKETVLEYMDKLALNRVVYSSLVKGFEPYLEERNLLFYIHGTNMVVVCFDLCGKNEELADEGDPIFLDDPKYYSQKGSRVSPVFQLSEALKEMNDRMVNIFPPMDIYGVLLSESTFLNAKDCQPTGTHLYPARYALCQAEPHGQAATPPAHSRGHPTNRRPQRETSYRILLMVRLKNGKTHVLSSLF